MRSKYETVMVAVLYYMYGLIGIGRCVRTFLLYNESAPRAASSKTPKFDVQSYYPLPCRDSIIVRSDPDYYPESF